MTVMYLTHLANLLLIEIAPRHDWICSDMSLKTMKDTNGTVTYCSACSTHNWIHGYNEWHSGGTKADVLSIYALSDMLKKHSYIVTKHRPWTTVDPSVQGTTMEILQLCPVKLVYLGEKQIWETVA